MNRNTTTPKAEKKGLRGFIQARGTRKGAVSVTVTVLFIAAAVLLNIVLSAVTDRYPLYLDVTENAAFRLQETTAAYTAQINKPVTIYVLQNEADFENGDSTNYTYYIQANKLIRAIANSSDQIDLHYIDITSEPTFTADYPQIDWTKSHIALVVCDDRYRAVDLTDLFTYDEEQYYYYGYYVINGQNVEQAILTAIMNVTTEEKPKVTVLSGQGEQELTAFTTLLENNAYEVEQVSLLSGTIAEDSEFVIIYDPDVDIDSEIYTTLSDWLYHDGLYGRNLFYWPNDQHDVAEYPNLNALLAEYGMEVQYGYIYENAADHVIPGYSNHYISIFDYADDTAYIQNLRNPSIPVVMSLTMPITVTDSDLASPLLTSSEESFFIPMGLDDESAAAFEPAAASLNGAAIGQKNDGTTDGKSSSVVVIGSYDAMTTNYLSISSYNNAAYFVNLFNTLSDRDDVSVVIEGKDPGAAGLGITSVSSISFVAVLVRFVIPIAVLLAGLIIWIRRRHK